MVRFSCFNGHNNSHKPKKPLQPSFEAYHKNLQDTSSGHFLEGSLNKASPLLSLQIDSQVSNGIKNISSTDCGWMSEDMKSLECDLVSRKLQLKKSQSLGSGLCEEGRVSAENDVEDETDQGFSCDDSNELNGFEKKDGSVDREGSTSDKYQKAPIFDSLRSSCDNKNDESIFSIADQPCSEKECLVNSDTPALQAAEFSDRTLPTPRGVVKSRSLFDLGDSLTSEHCAHLGSHSRSFEDLHGPTKKIERSSVQGPFGDDKVGQAENGTHETCGDDNYDSRHYSSLAKDWIMPVVENDDTVKSFQKESSLHQWVELPNRDFKIKRIEEWVNDLQRCRPLEESDEPLDRNDNMEGDLSVLDGLAAAKKEDKLSPGMEAAKRYVSSLSAVSTTAQLANHGLVVIPFLSTFASLRLLNLSGNAIVRITAGALPRGLHMLNLSKNSISTIEGLRELTRLRVLDLSYNRILRIGHGLASCSSLKELYLAGNKISEVEGLHRLLKLTVLDLRFNKISTAKCLGQLAANYNSLQAISLEGNPAQKNVGDDQLKKHLQGLLPYLAYFNRQTIKVSTLKDASERSVRLGVSAHQFDRGLRPDHKAARKGSHVLAAHGRGSQAAASSPKPSKGRHGRLPPTGTKVSGSNRYHHVDFGTRIMNLRQDLSMRRSRSEGTLGAL